MFKFVHPVLDVLISMVARIKKEGRTVYIPCDEWEPRPEVPYELLRAVEIRKREDNGLQFKFEVRDDRGILDPFDFEAGRFWKYSSPKGLTVRLVLNERTYQEIRVATKQKEDGKFELDVQDEVKNFEQDKPKEKRVAPLAVHIKVIGAPRQTDGLASQMDLSGLPVKPDNGHGYPDPDDIAGREAASRRTLNV